MPNNTMKERGREWEERCKLEVFDFSAAAAPKGVKRERPSSKVKFAAILLALAAFENKASFLLFQSSSVSSYQA